jgi:N-ethylmaleimide reductase
MATKDDTSRERTGASMPGLLFTPAPLGRNTLRNRIVMAPMTRNRAPGNIPNALMALYYRQRAGAGLIVTEGTSPSPNGLGYVRIPGIFSPEQVEAWKAVTRAVHEEGGVIFLQIMHTGRVTHPNNIPPGARVLAPSAIQAAGTIFAAGAGRLPFPTPQEMTATDIRAAVAEYGRAAANAVAAGFDGVELHGANGYLIEQFLRPATNVRTDGYGGSAGARARFALEAARAAVDAIGRDRVGMRLSPYGATNDMRDYEGMEEEYGTLASELGSIGILYLHLVDHRTMGSPPLPESAKRTMRSAFRAGTLVLSGAYDAARAEQDLAAGNADLIAVGRPFIANPDLPERWKRALPLATPDRATFYSEGEQGYTDYPASP